MKEVRTHRAQYLNGLNGLRALFALILLLGHIAQTDFCNWGVTLPKLPLPIGCAYAFLALSGFLAGYRSHRHVSFHHYYKKKAERILPLYYSYLAVVLLAFLALGRMPELYRTSLWFYGALLPQIPFCSNTGLTPLVHLWFIGVLVLFYLIFPLFTRIKEHRQKTAALAISICWFALKSGIYLIAGKDTFIYRLISVTSFDCLFLGVYAGLLVKDGNKTIKAVSRNILIAIAAWLLFLASGFYGHYIPAPIRNEYAALLSILLILNVSSSKPLINLENGVCNWLGDISYEIYVVQILTIMLLSIWYRHLGYDFPIIVVYLLSVIAVIAASWVFNRAIGLRKAINK